MLQSIKVWLLRRYYRFISARGWRQQKFTDHGTALQIPGPAGLLGARLYRGSDSADRPLIVYFHGGGWVIGDLETHHPFCQTLSQDSGCTVIALDYRLAPEHPFPAANDDCLGATRWIAEHIGDFGPSNGTLVLAGDSAGGNLATCTCLELDDSTRSQVVGQVLKYPVVDHYQAQRNSYVEHASGQALTTSLMIWFWDTYLADTAADAPAASRAMPLRSADLASLPSSFVITAELDPLRDEGIAYAEKLREAGVATQHRHFENAAHGFACSEGPSEDFRVYMDELTTWLKQLD